MENKATKAAFGLTNYKFVKVEIYYDLAPNDDNELSIEFNPSGEFNTEKKLFILKIKFNAYDESKGIKKSFIHTVISADFNFENITSLDDIPSYFYKNSIAIVYPYIRAFVSNLSLQANVGSFILPTLNLSMLENTLKENTISI